ncbi:hypothetical protein [Nannocystis punicea]|uniref:Uncharacterized protein n=1 Tax=Nannocystis punicea TaxID=2995304 RepID=A0ABY7HH41_9BACT|nr:hypothetical protein [Nannocystis poenicansa]WAS98637.1 hypothetical protein O0S08_21075 [Nannocystis poenicansa]
MSEDGYEREPLILNPWPRWVGDAHGSWARRFTFVFVAPVAAEALAAVDVDQPDLTVRLARGAAPCELQLVATTCANPRSDAVFFFQFHDLFARLEQIFGRIETIEGQARQLWRPFRE